MVIVPKPDLYSEGQSIQQYVCSLYGLGLCSTSHTENLSSAIGRLVAPGETSLYHSTYSEKTFLPSLAYCFLLFSMFQNVVQL